MKPLQISICSLLAFAVAAHGAVEPWSRAVLETGAGILLVFWAVRMFLTQRDSLQISPLLPPLLGLALLAFGQLVFHTSVSAYDTRVELQLLVAYAVLLLLANQAFREPDDWRLFIWFAMCFGFAASLFGILQHLTFNGKLYWVREMRFGGIPFGPYVNRNHFAGFAELVIPISLVPLALGKVRRERLFIVGVLALFPVGALFLCSSRGGLISFAAEILVLALIMILRRSAGKHVLAGLGILGLSLALVSWLGVGKLLERFSSMQSLEVTAGKRAAMRHDTSRIFRDHLWTGTGLGTLQVVYPAYETLYDAKIVNHSHDDYLEALAETGLVGGLCCACFLGSLFFLSLRQIFFRDKSFAAALHISGLVACSGLLVHSLVDFNLHIPANALLFFMMAHLATAEIPTDPRHSRSLRDQRSDTPALVEITH
jgi:O-antigen ligase